LKLVPEHSFAIAIARQAAAAEAKHHGSPWIEPAHLMIGACSIKKLLGPGGMTPPPTESQRGDVLLEWDAWEESLSEANLEAPALRRELRDRVSTAKGDNPKLDAAKIARSPASRAVFASAEKLANDSAGGKVSLLHLASALIEHGDPHISGAVMRLGGSIELLRYAIRRHMLSTTIRFPSRDNDTESGAPGMIMERMDATVAPFFASPQSSPMEARAAFLYELPLLFGKGGTAAELLQVVVSRLADVIPAVTHAALLVRDRVTGELNLEAHLPPGTPAASLQLAEQVLSSKQGLLWVRGETQPTASLDLHNIHSGIYAPMLWEGQSLGVVALSSTDAQRVLTPQDLRLVVAAAHHAAMTLANRQFQGDLQRKTELLEHLLANFSPRIRTLLLERASHGRLRLGGQKSIVTILNSDIRGFTKLTAGLPTDVVLDMLNDYFAVLVNAIFQFDGTVDKFIGDGILAVFGSPEPDPAHHEKAAQAALAMQQAMRECNEARSARGLVTCEIGIGIHSGEVLHGFVGSTDRMEFTVIGDAVNRAARYCAGAKGGEILLSPEIYQHLWKSTEVEAGKIETKHEGDFQVYRLKGMKAAKKKA
jgi:adenylate cyclase